MHTNKLIEINKRCNYCLGIIIENKKDLSNDPYLKKGESVKLMKLVDFSKNKKQQQLEFAVENSKASFLY